MGAGWVVARDGVILKGMDCWARGESRFEWA